MTYKLKSFTDIINENEQDSILSSLKPLYDTIKQVSNKNYSYPKYSLEGDDVFYYIHDLDKGNPGKQVDLYDLEGVQINISNFGDSDENFTFQIKIWDNITDSVLIEREAMGNSQSSLQEYINIAIDDIKRIILKKTS